MLTKISNYLERRSQLKALAAVAQRVFKRENFMMDAIEFSRFVESYRPYKDIGIVYERDLPMQKVDAMVLGICMISVVKLNPFGFDEETLVNALRVGKTCFLGASCVLSYADLESMGLNRENFEGMLSVYDNHESLVRAAPETMEGIVAGIGSKDRYDQALAAWEKYVADPSISMGLLKMAMKNR